MDETLLNRKDTQSITAIWIPAYTQDKVLLQIFYVNIAYIVKSEPVPKVSSKEIWAVRN